MKKKGNVLIVLNMTLVIGLVITLYLGIKHYKQISNNSDIQEHQINTMVNTIKNEINTKEVSNVKVEEKINIEDQNKKNEVEVDDSSINSESEITYKLSNNNSRQAVKSSKKAQTLIETPKKEKSIAETAKEEQTKPVEVINQDSTISKEDNSKKDNVEIKEDLTNNNSNQSEIITDQSTISGNNNSTIDNSTNNNIPTNSEIIDKSNNDIPNKN